MIEYRNHYYTESDYNASLLKTYMLKVYSFMGAALLLTAVVAYFGYQSLISRGFVYDFLQSGSSFVIVILVQLGVAFALGSGIRRFPTYVNIVLLTVYAIITGLTFSVLPLLFAIATIYQAFIYAALLFGSLVMVGTFTKVDLSRFSGILLGGLVAIIIASVLSMFIPSLRENMFISYAALALFMGLTAFDAQKIKSYALMENGQVRDNLAVFGAFQLYLDFINMFIRLLQILGYTRRRD